MTPDQIRIQTIRNLGLTPLEAKIVLALYADRDGPMSISDLMDAVETDSQCSLRTRLANVRIVLGADAIQASNRVNPTYWMTAETHDRIGRILGRKAAA